MPTLGQRGVAPAADSSFARLPQAVVTNALVRVWSGLTALLQELNLFGQIPNLMLTVS